MPGFRFSASKLKWIAVVTMLIDHIGAAIVLYYVNYLAAGMVSMDQLAVYDAWRNCYLVLRYIGRISFPIYAFLLVEGYYHTRNAGKYLRNLLLMAFVSEIPFDLALRDMTFDWEHQNVFWTLAIGLACMMVIGKLQQSYLLSVLIFSLGAGVAYLLHTDYDATGVFVIALLFLLRNQRFLPMAGAAILLICFSTMEITALLCIPLVELYDGSRGRQNKYFFYLFYPVHFMLLYGIRLLILPSFS